MQQTGAVEQSSEAFFSQIPFQKVDHEGGIGGDNSIIKHRCAEVLAPSPLDIRECLQWIFCRSEAERATLIYALAEYSNYWLDKIIVSDDLKVFEKRFAYVESVSLSNEGIRFKINARGDLLDISLKAIICNSTHACIGQFRNDLLVTNARSTNWIAKISLSPGNYYVKFELEDQIAYESKLDLNLSPF